MARKQVFSSVFFERHYILLMYRRFGYIGSILVLSLIAFLFGLAIIIPVNMLIGGSIITGVVINLIICCTFLPFHLNQILGLLIEMNALRGELYEKSIRDELTKAYNRRYFFEAAQVLKDLSALIPQNTSILMIDLDDFKMINDTHGHQVGDQALKSLTEQLSSILRSTDIFARYGGDEFICLLPQSTSDQAMEAAKRVSEHISKVIISSKDGGFPLRSSIGVAHSEVDMKLEELISHADQALYSAKHSGKNRIHRFTNK